MPFAPPRSCPSCGALVAGKRCPACTAQADRARGSARQRGYDGEWQRFRAAFLTRHPMCDEPGCGQPATDVDHIQPLRLGGARLDPANCRPKCHPHHSRRTATEQRSGYGGMAPAKPVWRGRGPHGGAARTLGTSRPGRLA